MGVGRGQYCRWDAAPAVEDQLALDVRKLAKMGALNSFASGSLEWTWGSPPRVRARIGYRTDRDVITLDYTVDGDPVTMRVDLTYTRPNFGGHRSWFVCPLFTNGRACGRRVGILYLGHRLWGCRHCLGLAYRRCEENRGIRRVLGRLPRDEAEEWAEELNIKPPKGAAGRRRRRPTGIEDLPDRVLAGLLTRHGGL